MVMLHVQVSLELLALSAGLAMLIWALRNKGKGVALAKFFGVIIVVLSALGVLCAGYYYSKLWNAGYFDRPMMGMMGMHKEMMHQNNANPAGE